MNKFFPLLLASLLLVAGFTACGISTDIITAGLKVELTKIERTNDGSVQVSWRVTNPNVVHYVLSKVSNKVTLNGTVIGNIEENSPIGIPAQNQIVRTGILMNTHTDTDRVISQALNQGTAAYRMEATIILLIVDDNTEKIRLTGTGSVPVVAK